MKLPNAERAIIAEDKLVLYLLNIEHRKGGSKAKLLQVMGYKPEAWQHFETDIRAQHLGVDVSGTDKSDYGVRYEIVAPLTGPTGRTVDFRSVWQIDVDTDVPRLITMYPE